MYIFLFLMCIIKTRSKIKWAEERNYSNINY